MQSVEMSGIEGNTSRSRSGLRSGSWPHLRVLLMLGICGFPAVFFYSLSVNQEAVAHTRSSAVVAKVRVGRATADTHMLVRSPLPSPMTPAPAPKPVSTPAR